MNGYINEVVWEISVRGIYFSATKMAQQMKVLATKPYGQSAISEIHRVRRENQANSYKLSLDLDKSI